MNKIKDYYFCSAKIRPKHCIRHRQNLCCMHCPDVIECNTLNDKVKPCTLDDYASMDDNCEFSL